MHVPRIRPATPEREARAIVASSPSPLLLAWARLVLPLPDEGRDRAAPTLGPTLGRRLLGRIARAMPGRPAGGRHLHDLTTTGPRARIGGDAA